MPHPAATMVRLLFAALLFVAVPGSAQEAASYRNAVERAMRCIQAAMTDPLLPVGAMPEQIATVALARCFDEIERAVAAGGSGSTAKSDVVRIALRKDLHDFALEVASGAQGRGGGIAETSKSESTDPAGPRL